jgi:hypothetical protein
MLSKCANPSCAGSFRYLHEGRMFHLIVGAARGESAATHGPVAIERFWLCDKCSKTRTLVPRCVGGVPPIQVQVVSSVKIEAFQRDQQSTLCVRRGPGCSLQPCQVVASSRITPPHA